MNNKILTISIAAYNMEKYIDFTIKSLIDQRIIQDLEIFVVDDGGTDNSLNVAKKYAEKYPDSIFPIHKKNGGYGSTVNYSIAHATGKYFKLLDGDDWFDKDGLYELVMTLKNCNADVIITNRKQGSDLNNMHILNIYGIETNKQLSINELIYKRYFYMHEITYKTKIVKESGLHLPEHILYTDLIYAMVPFATAKTLYYMDSVVYCYRLGRAGQSVDRNYEVKHMDDHFKTCEFVCNFYEKMKSEHRRNLNYLLEVSAGSCVTMFRCFFFLFPLSKNSLNMIIEYENKIKNTSYDTYKFAENKGKFGWILKMLRKSNYLLYWPLKLVFRN